MNESDTFEATSAFALMLIGTPKAGKTTFALNFPEPYILDCDNNLAGALRYHEARGGRPKFWFDNPATEPDPAKRWSFCMKALDTAVKDPRPKTIYINGLTMMGQYLEAHILANSNKGSGGMNDLVIAGEKVMNMSQWGPFKNLMSKLVMTAKCSGKLFIMDCHETTETNETGAVLAYRPLLSGSLRHNIAGFFTDVWRCEASTGPKGPVYEVRFQPKNLMQIGNSLDIKEPSLNVTNKSRQEVWSVLSKYLALPNDATKPNT